MSYKFECNSIIRQLLKNKSVLSFFEKYYKLQEEWKHIEDPAYSISIGSHFCVTCSKFDYSSQLSCDSILCCNWHQKLIWNIQHLTYLCELYQSKEKFGTH